MCAIFPHIFCNEFAVPQTLVGLAVHTQTDANYVTRETDAPGHIRCTPWFCIGAVLELYGCEDL